MTNDHDDFIEYRINNHTGGTITYRINTATGQVQKWGSLKPGNEYVASQINDVFRKAAISITNGELKDVHEFDPSVASIPIDERAAAVFAKLHYLSDRMTYDQIAVRLNVSRSKVYSWLKKMNIIRHPRNKN